MKNTYHDPLVNFTIEFTDGKKQKIKVDFDAVYGMESSDILRKVSGDIDTFDLKAARKFKFDKDDNTAITQSSEFLRIQAQKGLTFEEVMEEYFKSNITALKNIEQIHALCFLERYCMEYEEVKTIVKKKSNDKN